MGGSDKPRPRITSNHRSCPSFSHLVRPEKASPARKKASMSAERLEEEGEEEEEEVQYKLTLMGSLPVHQLTTMAMLPWVVAEISRPRAAGGRRSEPSTPNQTVCLCVSASWVRCVSVLGEGAVWDPLTHTVLFECRPHQVTKLIHNSQEPSSFGCLVRDAPSCACYVFQCQDRTKVGLRVCVLES